MTLNEVVLNLSKLGQEVRIVVEPSITGITDRKVSYHAEVSIRGPKDGSYRYAGSLQINKEDPTNLIVSNLRAAVGYEGVLLARAVTHDL